MRMPLPPFVSVPFAALLCALLLLITPALYAQPITFYVSPTGNDAWSGQTASPNGARTNGPFATVDRAHDALRSVPAQDRLTRGVNIVLRAGTYHLQWPLQFEAQDSGSADAPTVLESYPGEQATLSGGRPVTNWRPYRDGILQANIRPLESGKEHTLDAVKQGNELFCGDVRMDLARWPNANGASGGGGWAFTAGVPVKDGKTQFYYAGDAPKRWSHPELAQAHIFANVDWSDDYRKIASIDTSRRLITLSSPTSYAIQTGRRFYVRNVLEELDAPGEWYLDGASATLYFYPPENLSASNAQISVLPWLVTIAKAHDIEVRGLTLEDATNSAVDCQGSSRVRVNACEIRNTGKDGIRIAGGDSCAVESCLIHDTGNGGISVTAGDRQTLRPGKMLISNNNIFRFGRLDECYTPGVSIDGVGITVTHNLIHDGPHAGILMGGNDHEISFNEIHHVCLETSDCGAIYTGRNWTFRGNKILCNKIHDVPGFGYKSYDKATREVVYALWHDAQAIYLDDGVSSFDVTGNIVYRIGGLGVELGGGRDSTISGNVFVDTSRGIGMDARYTHWAAQFADTLRERLHAMPYQTSPWRERYPKLAAPMRHDVWPEGDVITGNVFATTTPRDGNAAALVGLEFPSDATTIDRNVYWNAGAPVIVRERMIDQGDKWYSATWDDWSKTGFDRNSLCADPLFVAPASDDYRLRPESPIYKLGIPKMPWSEIGLLPSFPAAWHPSPDAPDSKPIAPAIYRYPLEIVPTPVAP
ncbi:MAG: right-handed parallel beta-helix repeat-containing protein [Capsulimonadaceae bacterium]|nr:right-handed parallel beta-helix repeat-containing protein [Capsulimonadaceae bacterium]